MANEEFNTKNTKLRRHGEHEEGRTQREIPVVFRRMEFVVLLRKGY
jgi:hypothetical protein